LWWRPAPGGDDLNATTGEKRPILEVRNLAATYEDRGIVLPVLASISLSIRPGEFVAVIGPSGSGKSTLLDIVAGLIEPDRGEVLLDGVRLPASERLGRAAYMRQKDLLLPWRTVVANAALALEVAGVPKREAHERARARLAEFGLAEFEAAYPAQLSGGMRQRVAFLRTLLAGRPLVLLDEPFGALDALTRAAMQDWLLHRLAGEFRTLLLVTHDVEEAIYLSDRVVVLTPRPATIASIEQVSLARPRERAMVTQPAFVAQKARVLSALGVLDRAPA
jgi:putative hydroxymethylpyrimidine transport system ATP-binding protein